MKRLAATLLLQLCALCAEPALVTFDATGRLLAQGPAAVRPAGLALASRDLFFGASSALLIDDRGNLNPVLFISGEDAEAGVLELFVGAQASPGPAPSSAVTNILKTSAHPSRVRYTKEAGGFGPVSRLDCGNASESASGPLYNEHGLLAGWHAVKLIDGQPLAFAIPLSRFDAISRTRVQSLAAWNTANNATLEADFQRGLGHLWADDFDGALFYFRKAVTSQPNSPRAWYHLAFAEGKNGHTKAKTAAYRKAVELEPNFAPAHYYLGFSLLMAGDGVGAKAEYKTLQSLDPAWAARLQLFIAAAHVDSIEDGKAVHRH